MSLDATKLDHAKASANLANRLHGLGDRKAALDAARDSVARFKEIFPDPTKSTNVDPAMVTALINFSEHLSDDKKDDDAISQFQLAVDIRRSLSNRDPTKHQLDLSLSLVRLSLLRLRLGPRDAALEACREVVGICPKLSTAGLDKRRQLAESLFHLSQQLKDEGYHTDALGPAQESVNLYQQLADDTPSYLTKLENGYRLLAVCYERSNRRGDAQEARIRAEQVRPAKLIQKAWKVSEHFDMEWAILCRVLFERGSRGLSWLF